MGWKQVWEALCWVASWSQQSAFEIEGATFRVKAGPQVRQKTLGLEWSH